MPLNVNQIPNQDDINAIGRDMDNYLYRTPFLSLIRLAPNYATAF